MSFYQGLAFWQVYKSIKTNKIKKCLKIICLTIQSNILLLKKKKYQKPAAAFLTMK